MRKHFVVVLLDRCWRNRRLWVLFDALELDVEVIRMQYHMYHLRSTFDICSLITNLTLNGLIESSISPS